MKSQPSFISARSYRVIGDSSIYFNHAVWASTAAFLATFSNSQFITSLSTYPSRVVARPHLFPPKLLCLEFLQFEAESIPINCPWPTMSTTSRAVLTSG